jgi:hypothetical protein
MRMSAASTPMRVAIPTTAEVKKMSKSNEHKKDFREDKFARAYYCQHARLNQLRQDKKQSRRKTRRKNKKLSQNLLTKSTKYAIIVSQKER